MVPAGQRAPDDRDLAVALAGLLFLVATTVAYLEHAGAAAAGGGVGPIRPGKWAGPALLFGLQLLAGIAVLALYRGQRWGWLGAGAVLGVWATLAALLGRPLTTLAAIGFALYLLARGSVIARPASG